jgi:trigger factor
MRLRSRKTSGQTFQGQEQQAFEQMRKDPNTVAALRAPIFEEKVVDFLLELADVKDKKVSREALFASDEDEHDHSGHDHDHDHGHHHDHDHDHDHDHAHDHYHHHHDHGEADSKKGAKKPAKKGKKA